MEVNRITRRRAITIVATAVAGLASSRSAISDDLFAHEWRGFAMGTDARIVFSGIGHASARATASMVSAEIERLERALSLFRDNSEIVRLNRDKTLLEPSGDMYRALELALKIAADSNGLFDPTVQALWETYVDWFAASADAGAPPAEIISRGRNAVDWQKVRLARNSVYLGDNQRLTLNGIGQGYVTDRVAELLRSRYYRRISDS